MAESWCGAAPFGEQGMGTAFFGLLVVPLCVLASLALRVKFLLHGNGQAGTIHQFSIAGAPEKGDRKLPVFAGSPRNFGQGETARGAPARIARNWLNRPGRYRTGVRPSAGAAYP